jgi:hypothetical protein
VFVTYIFSQGRILLQKLDDTIGQLGVIHAQALHLVHGEKNASQEELMFLLERQGEAVDDRAQNLQQLGDSVVSFRLVHELEENVVD